MAIISDCNNNEIEKLYDSYIESNHTKIVRYKNMTPTTKKLQVFHVNLWRPHDLFWLSEKIYVSIFIEEFI